MSLGDQFLDRTTPHHPPQPVRRARDRASPHAEDEAGWTWATEAAGNDRWEEGQVGVAPSVEPARVSYAPAETDGPCNPGKRVLGRGWGTLPSQVADSTVTSQPDAGFLRHDVA